MHVSGDGWEGLVACRLVSLFMVKLNRTCFCCFEIEKMYGANQGSEKLRVSPILIFQNKIVSKSA